MNDAEILIVQKSFARLLSVDKAVVTYFYSRIIEMDSDISNSVKKALSDNRPTLMTSAGEIIDSLGDLKSIEDDIKALGLNLKNKGLNEDDYQAIGSAFVDSLAYGFGKEFSWEIQNAWVKTYKTVVAIMLEGAKS